MKPLLRLPEQQFIFAKAEICLKPECRRLATKEFK